MLDRSFSAETWYSIASKSPPTASVEIESAKAICNACASPDATASRRSPSSLSRCRSALRYRVVVVAISTARNTSINPAVSKSRFFDDIAFSSMMPPSDENTILPSGKSARRDWGRSASRP